MMMMMISSHNFSLVGMMMMMVMVMVMVMVMKKKMKNKKKKKKKKNKKNKKKKKIAAGSNTTEANVVFEHTEDFILEICSHLPPTSVLRFKSVSKTWYSLISNPYLLLRNTANQFDKHPPIFPSILLRRKEITGDSKILILPPTTTTTTTPSDYDEQPYYPKLSSLLLKNLIDYVPEHDDLHEKKGMFMLLDSCNGLLLYRNCVKYVIPLTEKYNLYVCNPITHDYIKLPAFEQEEVREQGFKIRDYLYPNIVFDPSLSLTYKVVMWLICTTTIDHETIDSSSSSNLKEEEHYRLYVYSSVTRSWRLNQFPVPLIIGYNIHGRAVLCNGVLYWNTKCHSLRTKVSYRYDVEKDVISTLNFPKMPPEYSNRALLYFGECDGRLRLIEKYHNDRCVWLGRSDAFLSTFDVMELDKNDDLWTVKYRVNIGKKGYYDMLIRNNSFQNVYILDVYKTKMEETEEEEEVLLLGISDICIVPFNLSSSTFGKELRSRKKKPLSDYFEGFTEVLRYNTITLFPPSFS